MRQNCLFSENESVLALAMAVTAERRGHEGRIMKIQLRLRKGDDKTEATGLHKCGRLAGGKLLAGFPLG